MVEKRKVSVDGEDFDVELEKKGGIWNVKIQDKMYKIKVENKEYKNAKVKKKKIKRTSSGIISSSIPGKVISVSKNIGDKVFEGDVLLILEAMKMQNEIVSPVNGFIVDIKCLQGDSIEANVPLVIIDNQGTNK